VTNEATIDVEGVRKSLGATVALAGVDLHADAARVLAHLGPNGAGKTTLASAPPAGINRSRPGSASSPARPSATRSLGAGTDRPDPRLHYRLEHRRQPFVWTATADEILAKVRLVQTNIKQLVANNAK
jgi:ATPase subunit of ABC transporter with duplicated ATPase domains